MAKRSRNEPRPAPAAEPGPVDMAVVDSLLHPLAVEIRSLLSRSEQAALGRILIDDEENILQALRAGVELQSLFHAGDQEVSPRLRQALPPAVTVHEVARRTSKKLFGNEKISRIFAIARAPAPLSLADLADRPRDLVVLEGVSISGNVGAIVRTARALGAGGLVLLGDEPVDVYDRRLIRASRGHVFSLPVVACDAPALLAFCRQHGLGILVTTPHTDTPVQQIATISQRLAVVFGSEKRGCSDELLQAATLRVVIPMDPEVESLNVSAAAGIVLFHRAGFNRLAAG